jgi:hypothetical protein
MDIRAFYTLLRATIIGAKSISLLKMLGNDKSLASHHYGKDANCRLEVIRHRLASLDHRHS